MELKPKFKFLIVFILLLLLFVAAILFLKIGENHLDQALCKCEQLHHKGPRILNASRVDGDDLRWLASIFSIDDKVQGSGRNHLLT